MQLDLQKNMITSNYYVSFLNTVELISTKYYTIFVRTTV